MHRLTTPTHIFIMNVDPRQWDKFIISYKNDGRIVLEKTQEDEHEIEIIENEETGEIDEFRLSINLTQEETQKFKALSMSEVQFRCHYPTGEVIASNKIKFQICDVLNQEIL